jgi:vacuolar protein sorting-associated protein 33A
MSLQQRHGLFPRITGKGDNAKRLADLLIRMRSEVTAGADSSASNALAHALTPSGTIDNLIIIDCGRCTAATVITKFVLKIPCARTAATAR